MSFIIALIAFIITIGILVAVHEYGHFWVARKLGVKVLRYSIGFGKPLWQHTSKQGDKTEYVLAAIPIGGYVKMLDEREGEVDKSEVHRAFNRQVLWKRFAIVLAGPMANFLFAVIAYCTMYMVGINSLNPYVGEIIKDTPAEKAGFQAQDKIISINDQPARSLSDTTLLLLDEYLSDPSNINVAVMTKEGEQALRRLDLSSLNMLKEEGDYLEKTGLKPWLPYLPGVGEVLPDRPAAMAGLKANDRVLGANDVHFNSVKGFIDYVSKRPNEAIVLHIKRDEQLLDITVTPEATANEDKKVVGVIGVRVGHYISPEDSKKLHGVISYPFFEALQHGAKSTWRMTAMTFKVIGRLVTGEASVKNISGPITIANYAGKSMVISLATFIGFIAIVSVSLGVMNLLPVPMLDGGHLFYYMIEFVKGSPVSEPAQEIGMRVGIAMVGSLMVLAFYNDIMRLMQ